MSYRYDSDIVILNRYGKAGLIAKAELFETYDRIRDLTASGTTLGGSGMGAFGSMLLNFARTFGNSAFLPTMGTEALNIPGTSYYTPISGGTGILPGGQAAFGLAPFSQITGYPTGGAAPINGSSSLGALADFAASGIGAGQQEFSGIGDPSFPLWGGMLGSIPPGGIIAGGASPVAMGVAAGGSAAGVTAGAGFGRNWIMPAASIVSGIGGLLTTLGPFFGPMGMAGAAAGTVMNGLAGAVLNSFQHVSNRILNSADTILTNKVQNLETTIKMLDAQQEVVKKILKDSMDGDKKALDNI